MRPRITASNLAAWGWGAILLLAPAPAAGQRLAPLFATIPESFAESAAQPRAAAVAFGHPDDYRSEGALVGGIGVGLFSAYVGYVFCCGELGEPQNNVLAGLLGLVVGGAVGGVTGALVGGMFPKDKPKAPNP